MKKLIIILTLISGASCGKTKIDTTGNSTSTANSSNTGSYISCGSNFVCRQACDSEGNGVYKSECEYETRHNLAQHFSCDHLNACYGKQINADAYK